MPDESGRAPAPGGLDSARDTADAASPAVASGGSPAIARGLAAMARVSSRRPLITVSISLVLAVVAVAYTVHALTFITSNLRLLPQREHYVVLLKEYQSDFGELNEIGRAHV